GHTPEVSIAPPCPRHDVADNVLRARHHHVQPRKSPFHRGPHASSCTAQGNFIDLIWHIQISRHTDNAQHRSHTRSSSIYNISHSLFFSQEDRHGIVNTDLTHFYLR